MNNDKTGKNGHFANFFIVAKNLLQAKNILIVIYNKYK